MHVCAGRAHPFDHPSSPSMNRSRSTTRLAPHSLALIVLLAIPSREAAAQVRERPAPFDSVGRILAITPPAVITEQQLDFALDTIENSLRAAA